MNRVFELIGVTLKYAFSWWNHSPKDHLKKGETNFSNILLGQIVIYSIIFSLFIYYINHTFNN